MTSFCDQVAGDWELYLLGTLGPEEERIMAAHLKDGCPDCRRRYAEAQMLTTSLGNLAPRTGAFAGRGGAPANAVRTGHPDASSPGANSGHARRQNLGWLGGTRRAVDDCRGFAVCVSDGPARAQTSR